MAARLQRAIDPWWPGAADPAARLVAPAPAGPRSEPPGHALPAVAGGSSVAPARRAALVDHGQRLYAGAGASGGFRPGAVDGADRLCRGGGGGLLRHLERAVQPVLRAADRDPDALSHRRLRG